MIERWYHRSSRGEANPMVLSQILRHYVDARFCIRRRLYDTMWKVYPFRANGRIYSYGIGAFQRTNGRSYYTCIFKWHWRISSCIKNGMSVSVSSKGADLLVRHWCITRWCNHKCPTLCVNVCMHLSAYADVSIIWCERRIYFEQRGGSSRTTLVHINVHHEQHDTYKWYTFKYGNGVLPRTTCISKHTPCTFLIARVTRGHIYLNRT